MIGIIGDCNSNDIQNNQRPENNAVFELFLKVMLDTKTKLVIESPTNASNRKRKKELVSELTPH